mmetsp:Transcript_55007/g.145871  ORF Transcript_55007/g.145871 Transcript_55007/m.145871 type:complete len:211 (-) Transcript_55007:754-1386(-)
MARPARLAGRRRRRARCAALHHTAAFALCRCLRLPREARLTALALQSCPQPLACVTPRLRTPPTHRRRALDRVTAGGASTLEGAQLAVESVHLLVIRLLEGGALSRLRVHVLDGRLLLETLVVLLELRGHHVGAPLVHRLLVREQRQLEHVRLLLQQRLVLLCHLERLLELIHLGVALECRQPPLLHLLGQLVLHLLELVLGRLEQPAQL